MSGTITGILPISISPNRRERGFVRWDSTYRLPGRGIATSRQPTNGNRPSKEVPMRILFMVVFCVFALGCSNQSTKVKNVLPAPMGTKPEAAAQLEKGNALFMSREYAGAEQAFRQAIVADANLAEAHYNLALTLDRTGQTEEARKH